MTARTAERSRNAAVGPHVRMLVPLVIMLGLSGCAGVDSMLFGGDAPDADAPAAVSTAAPSSSGASESAITYQSPGSVSAPVATITPISIEPGSETGTAVGKTTAGLRAQIVELQKSIQRNAQGFSALRNAGASDSVTYHERKAYIVTRLQVGTTRGNPELVNEWNQAQSALDKLTANINQLNTLAKDAASDASSAHYTLDQISATLEVSGAVDEDHRQLRVLEDETSQTIVVLDRLLREVSDAVQRQTAYVANERANLTGLAGAIKSGEFYGTDFGTQIVSSAAVASAPLPVAMADAPLVVIRFDSPDVNYQEMLYTALRQALQSHPNAAFKIVAVSPKSKSLAEIQLAQTAAHRHAKDVVQTITDMGVPPSRLTMASLTDPAVQVSEVQVFLR